MKKNCLTIALIVLFLAISCGNAQIKKTEDPAQIMLTEFYSSYFNIITDIPPQPYEFKRNLLDSLIRIYCTQEARDLEFEQLEYGFDYLANNKVSGFQNENLTVVKDSQKDDQYIVSFDASYSHPNGDVIVKSVDLQVTVVKDGDDYKIAAVE